MYGTCEPSGADYAQLTHYEPLSVPAAARRGLLTLALVSHTVSQHASGALGWAPRRSRAGGRAVSGAGRPGLIQRAAAPTPTAAAGAALSKHGASRISMRSKDCKSGEIFR